mmetsp:Transcript_5375/g.16620  ORF Transcript_5375/g.16620 Transcript_5375/m.16620 type:complete len:601 (-) Transcript_5375:208-2010(-)
MGQPPATGRNTVREGLGWAVGKDAACDHAGGWHIGAGCCSEGNGTGSAAVVSVVQVCTRPPPAGAPQGCKGGGPSRTLLRSRLLAPRPWRSFGDHYELGRKIGEGSFGHVHEAIARLLGPESWQPAGATEGGAATGCRDGRQARRVAVKVFQVERLDIQVAQEKGQAKRDDIKRRASFHKETVMLASLEHPHIVRMHECFQHRRALYIVLELCCGGELYRRLAERVRATGGSGFDELQARVFFRQMLRAVSYLHAQRIVHRDLKTENFLLLGERGSSEEDTLKLCDFGTAARLSDARPRCMDHIGTLSYTSPEVYADQGAALPADAWSLGVVLYVLITGTNPFRVAWRHSLREEIIGRIRAGDFEQQRASWLEASAEAQDLVRHLLVLEEEQRLTCTQALQHSWLARLDALLLAPDSARHSAHAPEVVTLLQRLPRLAVGQRLALVVCAMALSDSELKALRLWRELFFTLDTDQDGRLDLAELALGLELLLGEAAGQLPKGCLVSCAVALDLDGSGAVEWSEWLSLAVLGSAGLSRAPEPLCTAFRLLDGQPPVPGEEPAGQLIACWEPEGCRPVPAAGLSLSLPRLCSVLSSMEVYERL